MPDSTTKVLEANLSGIELLLVSAQRRSEVLEAALNDVNRKSEAFTSSFDSLGLLLCNMSAQLARSSAYMKAPMPCLRGKQKSKLGDEKNALLEKLHSINGQLPDSCPGNNALTTSVGMINGSWSTHQTTR